MVKNHLKRLVVPKSWRIDKKSTVFVTRPNAGAHSFELGLPLNILFKDILKYCKTTKEVKSILQDKEVLVDGKRRHDSKSVIGFMDVLSIPSLNEFYRICLNNKGKLIAVKINKNESELKISKIINKKILDKNKVQLNLSDGRNIILKETKYKVGDSLLITIPKQEIKQDIKLEKDKLVVFLGGKYIGNIGTIDEIKKDIIIVKINEKKVQTAKRYAFVVGEKKPAIEISGKNEQNERDKSSKGNP